MGKQSVIQVVFVIQVESVIQAVSVSQVVSVIQVVSVFQAKVLISLTHLPVPLLRSQNSKRTKTSSVFLKVCSCCCCCCELIFECQLTNECSTCNY